jgi:hypothetical protein
MDMRIFLSLERWEFRDTITFFHPEVKFGTKVNFSGCHLNIRFGRYVERIGT